jgi:hypothetical protein
MKRIVILLVWCALCTGPVMSVEHDDSSRGQSQGYPVYGNTQFPSYYPGGDNGSHDKMLEILNQIKHCVCAKPTCCADQLRAVIYAFINDTTNASASNSYDMRVPAPAPTIVSPFYYPVLNASASILFLDPALGNCIKQKPIDVCPLILNLLEILSDTSLMITTAFGSPFNPTFLLTPQVFDLVYGFVQVVPECCPKLCCLTNLYTRVYEYVLAEVTAGHTACYVPTIADPNPIVKHILDIFHAQVVAVMHGAKVDDAVCAAITAMQSLLSAPGLCSAASDPAAAAFYCALWKVADTCNCPCSLPFAPG